MTELASLDDEITAAYGLKPTSACARSSSNARISSADSTRGAGPLAVDADVAVASAALASDVALDTCCSPNAASRSASCCSRALRAVATRLSQAFVRPSSALSCVVRDPWRPCEQLALIDTKTLVQTDRRTDRHQATSSDVCRTHLSLASLALLIFRQRRRWLTRSLPKAWHLQMQEACD